MTTPYKPGMTLMPGESTSISVEIPIPHGSPELGVSGSWEFREVPPPDKAPVQDRAKQLGLPDGLRVEKNWSGGWRCAQCNRMQPDDSELVWVPDSVTVHDPLWSVIDAGRRNAYNGSGSGWCIHCAKRLGSPVASLMGSAAVPALVCGAFACVMLYLVLR